MVNRNPDLWPDEAACQLCGQILIKGDLGVRLWQRGKDEKGLSHDVIIPCLNSKADCWSPMPGKILCPLEVPKWLEDNKEDYVRT